MAMTTKTREYCKFGAACKRATCWYLHPEREYENKMFYFFSNEPDYNSTQWPIESYDNSQLIDHESQQAYLQSFPWQYSTNQNLSYTQSQLSASSSFHSIVHNDSFDANNEQSNKLPTSSKPWGKPFTNCKLLESKFRFANENRYNRHRSISSTRLQQMKNEIQVLFRDNVFEISKQHQSLIVEQQRLLEDLDDDDDIKLQKEEYIEELKDQFEIFDQTILSLSSMNPMTLEEAHYLLNRVKREIERLKARLPIYARCQQLIDIINSNRVIILKADTGSGKSSQLIQYLADAGFADHGLFA
ncbi:unnamed protein product [Rotaria sp. Silwood2]|nr:unnamed protein product [Rotaria sp. Silwood2]CAF2521501.1 unnamed protein product [Rotaria sp. Silwood2]CAF2923718.1 unnamed protein product [Rotaria sp. Silwood2]CAF3858137.1 unnamed protein product [Rotaria sp. Silwood2]CAF3893149.1 unnamed protein product [Rotaria sp. Silwood2]